MAYFAMDSKRVEMLLLLSVAEAARLYGRHNDGATACRHPVAFRVSLGHAEPKR